MSRGLVVVAQPGCKRLLGLLSALTKGHHPAPQMVSWDEALESPQRLCTLGHSGDFLRVESPGADSHIWHQIARRGGLSGTFSDGQWRPGRAWFLGLSEVLAAWERQTQHLIWTHPAAHILTMTDKLACAQTLQEAQIPTPEIQLAATNPDAFREQLQRTGRHAVFVKPRWGSSGAGVLAFRKSGAREQITTTAQLADGVLWNEKRLHVYHDRKSIDALLSAVLTDGAVVQRWIPKAITGGGPFDLRVLVIRGKIAQQVARVGRGTITNLHILAERQEVALALAKFPSSVLSDIHDICRRTAGCFPDHHAIGIDVMVDVKGRPFVLECNAWGDYLPRLLSDGKDSYESQVDALFSWAA